jgi:digeranylgeranylglycerophospholipid reductase
MTERVFDAIVVGAGPAGSRVARDLASAGLNVALLEQHRGVGTPCHCSGLVTPRTLALADVGDRLVKNVIRGAMISLRGGEQLMVAGQKEHAYVIDRVELDRRLARQATDAGAQLLMSTHFVDFVAPGASTDRRDDRPLRVNVIRDGKRDSLSTRLIVGADGAHSRVAAQMHGGRATGSVFGLGADAEVDTAIRTDIVDVYVDPDGAPGWFGWRIPLGDRRVRLGTGSNGTIRPAESFRRLRSTFPSFAEARIMGYTGGSIPLWRPAPLVGDRVLLVGDAARQVKPTSGGGIYASLFAARLAAGTVIDAFRRNSGFARSSLRPYERAWTDSMGKEFRRQADMRRVFESLDERGLADVLGVASRAAVRQRVEVDADVDHHSPIALALLRENPMLAVRFLRRPAFVRAWLFGWARTTS